MQAKRFPTSRQRSSPTSGSVGAARICASVLLTTLLVGSCDLAPVDQTVGTIFQKPVSVASAPPTLAHLKDEPEPYRWPDFAHSDGSVSRTMWLGMGSSAMLENVLKDSPEWKAVAITLWASLFLMSSATHTLSGPFRMNDPSSVLRLIPGGMLLNYVSPHT